MSDATEEGFIKIEHEEESEEEVPDSELVMRKAPSVDTPMKKLREYPWHLRESPKASLKS